MYSQQAKAEAFWSLWRHAAQAWHVPMTRRRRFNGDDPSPQMRFAKYTANTRLLSARWMVAVLEQGRSRLRTWAWQRLVASAEFGRAREAVAKSLLYSQGVGSGGRRPLSFSNREETRLRSARKGMSPLDLF